MRRAFQAENIAEAKTGNEVRELSKEGEGGNSKHPENL